MIKTHTQWIPLAPFVDMPREPPSAPGVIARDRDGLGIASVHVSRARSLDFARELKRRFGIELILGPHRCSAGDVAFIATGPGSWLAIREGVANAFHIELMEGFGECAAIADQSDGQAVLRLSGPSVRDALGRLVPIDLHPRAFNVNDVAVTVAAHIGVTLWRLEDEMTSGPVFEIAVARSLAGSFWSALSAGAAQFGLKLLAASESVAINIPGRSERPFEEHADHQIAGR